MANFGTEFQRGLHKAGLEMVQYKDCIAWAFGELPSNKMRITNIINRWEERHGNIFLLKSEYEIAESARRIGKAWLCLKPDD